jgi:hypothetical protein
VIVSGAISPAFAFRSYQRVFEVEAAY